jgi:hypothetical protein
LFDIKAYWGSDLEYGEGMAKIEEEVKKIAPIKEPDLNKKEAERMNKAYQLEAMQTVADEKQKFLNGLFNHTMERTGDAEEILAEIRKFNPHCEKITLSTLMALNQGTNVINMSPAGYGKSRATKELLDMLELPYTEIVGHKAPTDFFNDMKTARGLVLIDESATLLKNNEILNLLLAALWTKKINWRDEEATVNANIVFNTNSLPRTPFMAALKDRCQFNQLRLDSERIKTKLLSDFDYKPNKEVWAKIRNNTFLRVELTEAEIEKVKEALRISCPKSVRDKGKLLAQAKFAKALFGTVDYVRLFIDIDSVAAVMASDMKRAEKVKAIAAAESVSEQTARRWLREESGD